MNRDTHYYFGGRSLRNDAVRYAASRAHREPENVWLVYMGQFATYVRPSTEPAPDETYLLCTAKFENGGVRLLFTDGRNEYVTY